MPNTFGFGTDTPGFSSTARTAIQKKDIDTLPAVLVSLPRGAVVAADLMPQSGDNFTLRVTEYPDIVTTGATALTEGGPPTPLKLGISTLDYTVAQQGAYTKVTDIADFQSPHILGKVAQDKIA